MAVIPEGQQTHPQRFMPNGTVCCLASMHSPFNNRANTTAQDIHQPPFPRVRLEAKIMKLLEESDPKEPSQHHRLAKEVQLSPLFVARCILAVGCLPVRSAREFGMHLHFMWWPALVFVLYSDLKAVVEQPVLPDDEGGDGAEAGESGRLDRASASGRGREQGKPEYDVLEEAILVLARLQSPIHYHPNAHLSVLQFLNDSATLLRPVVEALDPKEEMDIGYGVGSARVGVPDWR